MILGNLLMGKSGQGTSRGHGRARGRGMVGGRFYLPIAVLLCGVGTAPSYAVSLQTGLIGYWNFDEGSGLKFYDTAPFGTVQDTGSFTAGSPTWISGKFGTALYFDGNAGATIPTSTDLNIGTNQVTLSAWVYLEELPSQLSGTFGPIFDSGGDSYVIYLDKGANELRFKVTDTNTHAARPGIPSAFLTTGSWHHVAGVFDGTGSVGTATIYWDGVPKDTHIGNDGTGTGLIGSVRPGQVALLGYDGTYYTKVAIDDVGVWKRALTADEIQSIATGTHPLYERNPLEPVIHWKFDGDLTNSGTGGTMFNATLVDGAGQNRYVPAKAGCLGQALDLDNTGSTGGDYVQVNYTLANQGTIALWYKTEPWYNYQTLFDNSVNPDYWECWVYADGILRFRINTDTAVSYDLDNLGGPGQWYHVAVTWNRQTTDPTKVDLQLYVDGILRETRTGATWQDPGTTFFLAGGNNGNTYGNGIWDDVRIYERVLSGSEIYALAKVPEPSSGILLLLGGGGWVCFRLRSRRLPERSKKR